MTKTIFNMDTKLKKQVMKKVKKDGWTLSAFLNLAIREYVSGNLKISALARDLSIAHEEIRAGKYKSAEEVHRELGI